MNFRGLLSCSRSILKIAVGAGVLCGCASVVEGTGDVPGNGGSGNPSTTPPSQNAAPEETLDDLFGAPKTGTLTPDSLYGVWAGTANGADVRVKLTPTSITVAKRCFEDVPASGGRVAARVGTELIQVIESKTDTHLDTSHRSYCNVEFRPVVVSACSGGVASGCFIMKGTHLELGTDVFQGASGNNLGGGHDNVFTKLSD
jgi:hypothetical protein